MATALDNLGREINTANMTLGEIRGLISTLCGSKVGAAKPMNKDESAPANNASLDKLKTLFETYLKGFTDEVKEQQGFLQEVVDALKGVAGKREERIKNKQAQRDSDPVSKEERITAKSSDKLAREFHKTLGTKGSGWVHDPYCEKVLKQILAAITHKKGANRDTAMAEAVKAADLEIAKHKKHKESAAVGLAASDDDNDLSNIADSTSASDKHHERSVAGWWVAGPTPEAVKKLIIANYLLEKINKLSNAIQDNFLGFNGFNVIIKGISEEERKFTQEVRATAYEVAGVTKESMALQKVFEKIGTSYNETGMDRSELQKFYMKALKMGIKDTKTALAITKAQLNTERQIGVEAGSLNETFMAMAQAGRMNNAQIAQMGRGMRDVARSAGVSGESLVEAIRSSEQFTNNLRKAANLTASAVENITEISIRAKKLGIASEMQPLMQAMTSSTNLLFNSSRQTQAFLFQAAASVGRTIDLQNGVILRSKEGIKDMATGFDNVLKQFGVDGLDAVENLSDEAKRNLNLNLSAAFNLEVGDVISAIELMQEAGKGMAERLADINKQRKLNLTVEEKATLDEKERALKASKSLSILTALSEATKGTGTGIEGMNKALAKFEGRKGEFEEDLIAMGKNWGNSREATKQTIDSALENINAGRKKAGLEAVKIDSKDIEAALSDKDALNLVMDRLTKGEQELATANKDQLDPMQAMEGYLKSINDNIRNFTQSIFSKIFNSVLGKLIAIAGVLTSILVALTSIGTQIFYGFNSFGNYLSYWFNKKGAASGASAVAGAADDVVEGAAKTIAPKTNPWNDLTKTKTITPQANPWDELTKPKPKMGWMDTFTEKINQARSKLKEFGKSVERTTDQWSKSIVQSTDDIAEQVAKNPFKTYINLVKDSWKNTFAIAKEGSTNIASVVRQGFGAVIKNADTAISTIAQGTMSGLGKIPGLVMEIPNAVSTALTATKGAAKAAPALITRGIGNSLAAVTKVSGKAASGIFKVAASMNPLGLAVMGVFAAIDGLTGAMAAGARAGEIFGKKQEEVTLNEEYAAKSAGLLVGILNGLTLGIAGWILPLDKITDALARFNAKIPILTIVLGPLVVALEVLWGVIKGVGLAIWEIVKGIGGGIMNILTPVFEGLSDIFSTIGSMFGSTSDKAGPLVQAFREMGGVVGIVSNSIKFIGVAIGWIFRAVGSVIGFILKTFLKVVEGLMYAFEPFVEVLSAVWDGVLEVGQAFGEAGMAIWDVLLPIREAFQGWGEMLSNLFGGSESKSFFDNVKMISKMLGQTIALLVKVVLHPIMILAKVIGGIGKLLQAVVKLFKGDFEGAGQLVKDALWGVVKAALQPIEDIYNGVTGWFSYLYHWLVGGSLVPDLVNGIIAWFGKLPGMIYGFIGKVISAIADMAYSIPDMIWSMNEKIIDFALWPFKTILNFFMAGFGDKAVSNVKKLFKFVFNLITTPFKVFAKIISGIGKVIQAIGAVFNGDFGGAAMLIKNAVFGVFDAFLAPFKKIFDWLKTVVGWIKSTINWVLEPIATMKDAVFAVADYLYTSFTEALGKAWTWFTDFVKNPSTAVEKGISSVMSANSDENHEKTLKGMAETGKTVEKVVQDRVQELVKNPNQSKEEKLNQLTFDKKRYEDLAQAQRAEAARLQKEYDKQANSISGYTGVNAWLLGDLQKSQEQSLDMALQYSKRASVAGQGISELELIPNEMDETTAKSVEKLTEEATQKNSIYTHDTHCEALLNEVVQILSNYGGLSGFGLDMMNGKMLSNIGGGLDYMTGTKVGSTMLGKPPSEKAIETRLSSQKTESAKDTSKILYDMHILATTGKGLKVRLAKTETESYGLDKMNIQLANVGTNLLDIFGIDEGSLLPKPTTQAETTGLKTQDIDGEISKQSASTQPSEMVSPDLGELNHEAAEHTAQLAQVINLLQKFVDLAKPKSSIAGSPGIGIGDTATRKGAHRPANYYRSPIGHVSQTAAKAILNVGSQTT